MKLKVKLYFIYMIRIIKNIFKFKPQNVVHLGRWKHRICEKDKEIKSILSNIDNCGDKICGNPNILKNIIKHNKK